MEQIKGEIHAILYNSHRFLGRHAVTRLIEKLGTGLPKMKIGFFLLTYFLLTLADIGKCVGNFTECHRKATSI